MQVLKVSQPPLMPVYVRQMRTCVHTCKEGMAVEGLLVCRVEC
jgi:hypothetical protein